MSETIEEPKPADEAAEPKREHLCAHLSAKVLRALSPFIRETQEYSHSLECRFSQTPKKYCAAYVLPAERGCALVAVSPHSVLAVLDPEGHASRALRVYFPAGLLDAVESKLTTLADENGVPFTVECEPKPDRVHLSDGFGMVFPADIERWKGALGAWMNGDVRNVIKADSYRCEAASPSFLSQLFAAEESGSPAGPCHFDPALLLPMCSAAAALGLAVSVTVSGERLLMHSTDGRLFGILALLTPAEVVEPAESPLVRLLAGLSAAAPPAAR